MIVATLKADPDLSLLWPRHARNGVLVYIEQLLSVLGQREAVAVVLGVVGVVHLLPQGGQVACLLEALNRCLASAGQQDMPAAEGTNHYSNDARYDSEHDVIYGHECLDVLRLRHQLRIYPRPRDGKAVKAEEGRVDEEQQEGLVVVQADASGKPRAVVIHLQNTSLARTAVMGAVGLPGLALLAEAQLAIRFDGERSRIRGSRGGQRRVAMGVGGAAGIGEDGRRIAPVEQKIEQDAAYR